MTTQVDGKNKTNFKVWAVVLVFICLPIGFIHLYPDQPLWVTWLLTPILLTEAVVSRDAQLLEHFKLMGYMFLILLGGSWVIHCCAIWICRKRAH